MPEYLYPGVYVEELDTGNKPIEGVSTSTVGFLGVAERGPVTATYITSFTEFKRSFGGYFTDSKNNQAYLAYAVEGFFLNGGLRCWVARVASGTATFATATSGAGGGAAPAAGGGAAPAPAAGGAATPAMTVSAAGPGSTGKQIAFLISDPGLSTAKATLFKLTVYYWSSASDATTAIASFNGKTGLTPAPTQTEVFDNLSASPNSSTYYVGVVNGGSDLVTVAMTTPGRPPTNAQLVQLTTGGSDGGAPVPDDFAGVAFDPTKPLATPTGLLALNAVDDISLLCCPDEYYSGVAGIAGQLQAACETLKDRFAILQAAAQAGKPQSVTPSVYSNYAAFYYPWLNVVDPTSNVSTPIPPGGHVAGIYARSDTNENVAKDPANEQILGIDSLQLPIDNQTQAILNPIGVNCLRYFKGQGNLVWGGRTTSSDPDWQYINVRRLFIFVEKSIQRGTQWVVFENNDAITWARVIRSVSDFLTGLWMQDMLMGATKERAFFVRCDQTTMTQTDIESGRLIVLVGIAPVYPAEFVIFRIGQWAGGSSVSEG